MDDATLLRFSRQILLPNFGIAGQQCLAQSCALVVGLGGLGSPVALYLAAAGFGRLILVDDDQVDLSNLQRQIVHDTTSIGQPKVVSAQQRVAALNPDCEIVGHTARLAELDGLALIEQADVVVDCSDNFATRFWLNRVCYAARTPLVSGAALGWDGQVAVFVYQSQQACYRCVFEDGVVEENRCSENGVIAPLVGIIGSMQALEAIKVVTGVGQSLANRLLVLDGLQQQWRTIRLQPDPACPVCGCSFHSQA